MTFTLTIELGNDAMQTGFDVTRVLVEVGYKLDRHPLTKVDGGNILDANGNSVGQWEVK